MLQSEACLCFGAFSRHLVPSLLLCHAVLWAKGALVRMPALRCLDFSCHQNCEPKKPLCFIKYPTPGFCSSDIKRTKTVPKGTRGRREVAVTAEPRGPCVLEQVSQTPQAAQVQAQVFWSLTFTQFGERCLGKRSKNSIAHEDLFRMRQ